MALGEDLPGFLPEGVGVGVVVAPTRTVPNLPSGSTNTIRATAAEVVNVRTIDVADIADVIFLTKATMHTRMVADDNIVTDDA